MKLIKEIIKSSLISDKRSSIGLIGPPGVGKSDIVIELSKELNRPIYEFRAGYRNPSDLLGLPFAKDSEDGKEKLTSFLKTDLLHDLQALSGKKAILCLEEMTNASSDVLGVLYELILNRRLNNESIPEDCDIVFTGNRSEDAIGIATDLSSTIHTRATILKIEPSDISFNDWLEWAFKNKIHSSIVSYLSNNKNALLHESVDSSSYCTPRTWSILSKKLFDLDYLKSQDGKLYEDCISRVILTHIPDEPEFRTYFLDGILVKKNSEYIKDPELFFRSDHKFYQAAYNLAYYFNSEDLWKEVKISEFVGFWKNITSRKNLQEAPYLISILNQTNKDWIKNLQTKYPKEINEVKKLISDKIEEMNKTKMGEF